LLKPKGKSAFNTLKKLLASNFEKKKRMMQADIDPEQPIPDQFNEQLS
jgi:hypothetical protein